MKIQLSIFAFLLFSFTVSAQEIYSFKIGNGARQIPLDDSGLHDEGIYDIIVRSDTIYCLEVEQIHIMPIHGNTSRYIRFPLNNHEVAYSFCFLSKDSLAIVIKRTDDREISLIFLSINNNKVLTRIDCSYDISSNEFQGITYKAGKLFIPVTSWTSGIIESFLIVDIKTTKTTIISQDDYFKNANIVHYDHPRFSDNAILYISYSNNSRNVTIIDSGKKFAVDIIDNGRATEIPPRLDSSLGKLWFSEIENDSLVIKSIKYK